MDSSSLRSATASQIIGGGDGLRSMTREDFTYYWTGIAKVITPTKVSPVLSTTNGSYNVVGKPTITAAQINKTLALYNSPAAGKKQALYDLGVKYAIDPNFALAFFGHESTFGTQGKVGTTHSQGQTALLQRSHLH